MKKILLFLLISMLPVLGYGEVVSSVHYNPSRMGEYNYLKVSDKANFRGGLQTPILNIATSGTASVSTDSTSRIYEIQTMKGASGSAVEMPSAVFHGDGKNTYSFYKSSSTSTPGNLLPVVNANGGEQTYTDDSYIGTVEAVSILRQKTGTLKGTTFSITGSEGSAISLYNDQTTYGFHLAGNDIPEPTGTHTNTGKPLSRCQFVWEKRRTSGDPVQEVWLLALKNCVEGEATGDCETNFQVNDNCCEWIWSNRSGQMSSSKFTGCWRACTGNVYSVKEDFSFNPNTCPSPVSSSSMCTVDPGVLSGSCEGKQGPANAHCLVSTTPTKACQYYTADQAYTATGGKLKMAGYYTFYRYRECGNATHSCAVSTAHMDFSNGPTSPVCYCRF